MNNTYKGPLKDSISIPENIQTSNLSIINNVETLSEQINLLENENINNNHLQVNRKSGISFVRPIQRYHMGVIPVYDLDSTNNDNLLPSTSKTVKRRFRHSTNIFNNNRIENKKVDSGDSFLFEDTLDTYSNKEPVKSNQEVDNILDDHCTGVSQSRNEIKPKSVLSKQHQNTDIFNFESMTISNSSLIDQELISVNNSHKENGTIEALVNPVSEESNETSIPLFNRVFIVDKQSSENDISEPTSLIQETHDMSNINGHVTKEKNKNDSFQEKSVSSNDSTVNNSADLDVFTFTVKPPKKPFVSFMSKVNSKKTVSEKLVMSSSSSEDEEDIIRINEAVKARWEREREKKEDFEMTERENIRLKRISEIQKEEKERENQLYVIQKQQEEIEKLMELPEKGYPIHVDETNQIDEELDDGESCLFNEEVTTSANVGVTDVSSIIKTKDILKETEELPTRVKSSLYKQKRIHNNHKIKNSSDLQNRVNGSTMRQNMINGSIVKQNRVNGSTMRQNQKYIETSLFDSDTEDEMDGHLKQHRELSTTPPNIISNDKFHSQSLDNFSYSSYKESCRSENPKLYFHKKPLSSSTTHQSSRQVTSIDSWLFFDDLSNHNTKLFKHQQHKKSKDMFLEEDLFFDITNGTMVEENVDGLVTSDLNIEMMDRQNDTNPYFDSNGVFHTGITPPTSDEEEEVVSMSTYPSMNLLHVPKSTTKSYSNFVSSQPSIQLFIPSHMALSIHRYPYLPTTHHPVVKHDLSLLKKTQKKYEMERSSRVSEGVDLVMLGTTDHPISTIWMPWTQVITQPIVSNPQNNCTLIDSHDQVSSILNSNNQEMNTQQFTSEMLLSVLMEEDLFDPLVMKNDYTVMLSCNGMPNLEKQLHFNYLIDIDNNPHETKNNLHFNNTVESVPFLNDNTTLPLMAERVLNAYKPTTLFNNDVDEVSDSDSKKNLIETDVTSYESSELLTNNMYYRNDEQNSNDELDVCIEPPCLLNSSIFSLEDSSNNSCLPFTSLSVQNSPYSNCFSFDLEYMVTLSNYNSRPIALRRSWEWEKSDPEYIKKVYDIGSLIVARRPIESWIEDTPDVNSSLDEPLSNFLSIYLDSISMMRYLEPLSLTPILAYSFQPELPSTPFANPYCECYSLIDLSVTPTSDWELLNQQLLVRPTWDYIVEMFDEETMVKTIEYNQTGQIVMEGSQIGEIPISKVSNTDVMSCFQITDSSYCEMLSQNPTSYNSFNNPISIDNDKLKVLVDGLDSTLSITDLITSQSPSHYDFASLYFPLSVSYSLYNDVKWSLNDLNNVLSKKSDNIIEDIETIHIKTAHSLLQPQFSLSLYESNSTPVFENSVHLPLHSKQKSNIISTPLSSSVSLKKLYSLNKKVYHSYHLHSSLIHNVDKNMSSDKQLPFIDTNSLFSSLLAKKIEFETIQSDLDIINSSLQHLAYEKLDRLQHFTKRKENGYISSVFDDIITTRKKLPKLSDDKEDGSDRLVTLGVSNRSKPFQSKYLVNCSSSLLSLLLTYSIDWLMLQSVLFHTFSISVCQGMIGDSNSAECKLTLMCRGGNVQIVGAHLLGFNTQSITQPCYSVNYPNIRIGNKMSHLKYFTYSLQILYCQYSTPQDILPSLTNVLRDFSESESIHSLSFSLLNNVYTRYRKHSNQTLNYLPYSHRFSPLPLQPFLHLAYSSPLSFLNEKIMVFNQCEIISKDMEHLSLVDSDLEKYNQEDGVEKSKLSVTELSIDCLTLANLITEEKKFPLTKSMSNNSRSESYLSVLKGNFGLSTTCSDFSRFTKLSKPIDHSNYCFIKILPQFEDEKKSGLMINLENDVFNESNKRKLMNLGYSTCPVSFEDSRSSLNESISLESVKTTFGPYASLYSMIEQNISNTNTDPFNQPFYSNGLQDLDDVVHEYMNQLKKKDYKNKYPFHSPQCTQPSIQDKSCIPPSVFLFNAVNHNMNSIENAVDHNMNHSENTVDHNMNNTESSTSDSLRSNSIEPSYFSTYTSKKTNFENDVVKSILPIDKFIFTDDYLYSNRFNLLDPYTNIVSDSDQSNSISQVLNVMDLLKITPSSDLNIPKCSLYKPNSDSKTIRPRQVDDYLTLVKNNTFTTTPDINQNFDESDSIDQGKDKNLNLMENKTQNTPTIANVVEESDSVSLVGGSLSPIELVRSGEEIEVIGEIPKKIIVSNTATLNKSNLDSPIITLDSYFMSFRDESESISDKDEVLNTLSSDEEVDLGHTNSPFTSLHSEGTCLVNDTFPKQDNAHIPDGEDVVNNQSESRFTDLADLTLASFKEYSPNVGGLCPYIDTNVDYPLSEEETNNMFNALHDVKQYSPETIRLNTNESDVYFKQLEEEYSIVYGVSEHVQSHQEMENKAYLIDIDLDMLASDFIHNNQQSLQNTINISNNVIEAKSPTEPPKEYSSAYSSLFDDSEPSNFFSEPFNGGYSQSYYSNETTDIDHHYQDSILYSLEPLESPLESVKLKDKNIGLTTEIRSNEKEGDDNEVKSENMSVLSMLMNWEDESESESGDDEDQGPSINSDRTTDERLNVVTSHDISINNHNEDIINSHIQEHDMNHNEDNRSNLILNSKRHYYEPQRDPRVGLARPQIEDLYSHKVISEERPSSKLQSMTSLDNNSLREVTCGEKMFNNERLLFHPHHHDIINSFESLGNNTNQHHSNQTEVFHTESNRNELLDTLDSFLDYSEVHKSNHSTDMEPETNSKLLPYEIGKVKPTIEDILPLLTQPSHPLILPLIPPYSIIQTIQEFDLMLAPLISSLSLSTYREFKDLLPSSSLVLNVKDNIVLDTHLRNYTQYMRRNGKVLPKILTSLNSKYIPRTSVGESEKEKTRKYIYYDGYSGLYNYYNEDMNVLESEGMNGQYSSELEEYSNEMVAMELLASLEDFQTSGINNQKQKGNALEGLYQPSLATYYSSSWISVAQRPSSVSNSLVTGDLLSSQITLSELKSVILLVNEVILQCEEVLFHPNNLPSIETRKRNNDEQRKKHEQNHLRNKNSNAKKRKRLEDEPETTRVKDEVNDLQFQHNCMCRFSCVCSVRSKYRHYLYIQMTLNTLYLTSALSSDLLFNGPIPALIQVKNWYSKVNIYIGNTEMKSAFENSLTSVRCFEPSTGESGLLTNEINTTTISTGLFRQEGFFKLKQLEEVTNELVRIKKTHSILNENENQFEEIEAQLENSSERLMHYMGVYDMLVQLLSTIVNKVGNIVERGLKDPSSQVPYDFNVEKVLEESRSSRPGPSKTETTNQNLNNSNITEERDTTGSNKTSNTKTAHQSNKPRSSLYKRKKPTMDSLPQNNPLSSDVQYTDPLQQYLSNHFAITLPLSSIPDSFSVSCPSHQLKLFTHSSILHPRVLRIANIISVEYTRSQISTTPLQKGSHVILTLDEQLSSLEFQLKFLLPPSWLPSFRPLSNSTNNNTGLNDLQCLVQLYELLNTTNESSIFSHTSLYTSLISCVEYVSNLFTDRVVITHPFCISLLLKLTILLSLMLQRGCNFKDTTIIIEMAEKIETAIKLFIVESIGALERVSYITVAYVTQSHHDTNTIEHEQKTPHNNHILGSNSSEFTFIKKSIEQYLAQNHMSHSFSSQELDLNLFPDLYNFLTIDISLNGTDNSRNDLNHERQLQSITLQTLQESLLYKILDIPKSVLFTDSHSECGDSDNKKLTTQLKANTYIEQLLHGSSQNINIDHLKRFKQLELNIQQSVEEWDLNEIQKHMCELFEYIILPPADLLQESDGEQGEKKPASWLYSLHSIDQLGMIDLMDSRLVDGYWDNEEDSRTERYNPPKTEEDNTVLNHNLMHSVNNEFSQSLRQSIYTSTNRCSYIICMYRLYKATSTKYPRLNIPNRYVRNKYQGELATWNGARISFSYNSYSSLLQMLSTRENTAIMTNIVNLISTSQPHNESTLEEESNTGDLTVNLTEMSQNETQLEINSTSTSNHTIISEGAFQISLRDLQPLTLQCSNHFQTIFTSVADTACPPQILFTPSRSCIGDVVVSPSHIVLVRFFSQILQISYKNHSYMNSKGTNLGSPGLRSGLYRSNEGKSKLNHKIELKKEASILIDEIKNVLRHQHYYFEYHKENEQQQHQRVEKPLYVKIVLVDDMTGDGAHQIHEGAWGHVESNTMLNELNTSVFGLKDSLNSRHSRFFPPPSSSSPSAKALYQKILNHDKHPMFNTNPVFENITNSEIIKNYFKIIENISLTTQTNQNLNQSSIISELKVEVCESITNVFSIVTQSILSEMSYVEENEGTGTSTSIL